MVVSFLFLKTAINDSITSVCSALILGVPFVLLIAFTDYKAAIFRYKEQTKDWDKYKTERKNKLCSDYKEYARNLALYGSRTMPMLNLNTSINDTPKCPICGSTKVKKISTVSRATSVAMAGLASSKIGKQMVCEK